MRKLTETTLFSLIFLGGLILGLGNYAASRAAANEVARRTRVLVTDDFEAGIVKRLTTDILGKKTGFELAAEAPRLRCMVPASDPENKADVKLSSETAASGQHSLMVQNSKTIKLGHTPGLSWWLRGQDVITSGTLEMTFSLYNPAQNGSDIMFLLRDYNVRPMRSLGLSWNKKNVLHWGKERVRLPADTWIKYKFIVPVGPAKSTLRLTITEPGKKPRELEKALKKPIERLTAIHFLLNQKNTSRLYFDDLDFRVVNEKVPQPIVHPQAPPASTVWRDTPEIMLDVFPPPTVKLPPERRGKTVLSDKYYPSGSAWNPLIDERWVYHYEIKHEQEEHNSYLLRLGKGGQIYSLRGSFGESIPPSSARSPWNDEVWQFVAVCSAYNTSVSPEIKKRLGELGYRYNFFVHNSGAYMHGATGEKNLYCPLLGAAPTKDGRGYRTINWGLIPQLRTINRSPILYYVQTRDVGDGIIAMTYVVHNFDPRPQIVFKWLNAPWGGTRKTRLPWHYISAPDGSLMPRPSDNKVYGVKNTGGWNLSSATEDAASPSLALVFGRDKHLAREKALAKAGKRYMQYDSSIYRYMNADGGTDWHNQDWRNRPENTFRNYDVAVVIPKFVLAPGRTIWYRSYLVVNEKAKTMELAKSLVKDVEYGELIFKPEDTPLVPVYLKDGKVLAKAPAGVAPAFELYAKPVPGSKPLFLISNKTTGTPRITTDPYIFVATEELGNVGIKPGDKKYWYYGNARGYDLKKHNSNWERLLGYAYSEKPAAPGFVKLSAAAGAKLAGDFNEFNLDLWVKEYKP